MTTKELIERLNELEFVGKVVDEIDYIKIFNLYENGIGIVSKQFMYKIDTHRWFFNLLEKNEKKQLFVLLSEYASTAIEDRKHKQLYTAKSKIDSIRRLYRDVRGDYNILLNTFDESDGLTFEFTEDELKDVKGFNIWNSEEWIIEEVEK